MENTGNIRWGILGCGDVCEVKSGPAFNKIDHSELIAVMRRDEERVRDFAHRHQVPKYYTRAKDLIDDDEINAVYIATPPVYHEEYAITVIEAGKAVYIEKPVALNSLSCNRILDASRRMDVKASVAHYRRGLPVFKKVKSLIQSGTIGSPNLVICNTLQAPDEKVASKDYWRTNPGISGGGLFFDLAPHQLDIFYWLFGKPAQVRGYSANQKSLYDAPDLTNIEAVFENGVYLHGLWAFNVSAGSATESTEIIGDKGKIRFSFFRASDIEIITDEGSEKISLEYPVNIQQPMIADVVRYFRDEGPNPCSLEDALVTMQMMDASQARPWQP